MMPKVPDPDDPAHGLINPRLSDVFGMVLCQDEVDFVVPHLNEDLPLCLDPFCSGRLILLTTANYTLLS